MGTGGGSDPGCTSLAPPFMSATATRTARTATIPRAPRVAGETRFFAAGGGTRPSALAATSPIRRPVVIVGDSESGNAGADPTGPGDTTGMAAVGAMDAFGDGDAGGDEGGVDGGGDEAGDDGVDRTRFTRLSEKFAVEPTGEKPSTARRSSASSAASA